MFERFTDKARRVLVRAQEAARQRAHNYIGTEHLLLGLLDYDDTVAAQAFDALEVNREEIRRALDERLDADRALGPVDSPPFTPRAKKVLELSLRQALQLGDNYIGTEHMLLALVREGQGAAAVVLRERGIDHDRVRRVVNTLVAAGTREAHTAGPTMNDHGARLYANAIRKAQPGPVAPHRFLLAIFDNGDSLAARTLQALGVTEECRHRQDARARRRMSA